jgi:poly(3-hydroxyalkanoate) depolymerase
MDVTTIVVAGQKLRVATTTGMPGTRPLLVFNGFGADLDLLHGFAEELSASGIGIVVFDVPGIGGSSMPSFPYRFAWLAWLASEVLQRVGIRGQVDVAGMSWGGALAQEFTRRYPGRVRRLVLAATSTGAVAVPGSIGTLAKMLDPRLYVDWNYLAKWGGALYGAKGPRDATLLADYGKALRPVGCWLQLLAISGWTSAFWLRTLQAPTLVMMGAEDPIIPVVNGQLLAKLLPHARLVIVPDGHLFLMTSARECARLIGNFLAGEPASRPSRNGAVGTSSHTL